MKTLKDFFKIGYTRLFNQGKPEKNEDRESVDVEDLREESIEDIKELKKEIKEIINKLRCNKPKIENKTLILTENQMEEVEEIAKKDAIIEYIKEKNNITDDDLK